MWDIFTHTIRKTHFIFQNIKWSSEDEGLLGFCWSWLQKIEVGGTISKGTNSFSSPVKRITSVYIVFWIVAFFLVVIFRLKCKQAKNVSYVYSTCFVNEHIFAFLQRNTSTRIIIIMFSTSLHNNKRHTSNSFNFFFFCIFSYKILSHIFHVFHARKSFLLMPVFICWRDYVYQSQFSWTFTWLSGTFSTIPDLYFTFISCKIICLSIGRTKE
jgi:hypothetical protein